jgi:hypothetical protein
VRTSVGALDLAQAVPPDRVEVTHVTGIEPALREFRASTCRCSSATARARPDRCARRRASCRPIPCFAWCEGEVLASITFVEGGAAYRTKKLLV